MRRGCGAVLRLASRRTESRPERRRQRELAARLATPAPLEVRASATWLQLRPRPSPGGEGEGAEYRSVASHRTGLGLACRVP